MAVTESSWPGGRVISPEDHESLTAETAARVAAQIAAARCRATARRALYAEKRSRRTAGVDIRNRRKITSLESS